MLLSFILVLLFAAITAAEENVYSIGEPTIWTDKDDYDPGEIVLISGLGFIPESEVNIGISRPDGEVDTFVTNADSSGNLNNVEYELTEERAHDGDYDLCASDGTNNACTTFTDCGGCGWQIMDLECNEDEEIIIKAYYGVCKRRLRIEYKSEDGSTELSNEMEWWKTGKYIELNTELAALPPGTITFYREIKWLWFKYWKRIGQKNIEETFTCPSGGPGNVPEFSTTGIIAAGLAIMGVFLYMRKKKK